MLTKILEFSSFSSPDLVKKERNASERQNPPYFSFKSSLILNFYTSLNLLITSTIFFSRRISILVQVEGNANSQTLSSVSILFFNSNWHDSMMTP